MISDTQILSYHFSGKLSLPSSGLKISSITALEFLLVQSRDHLKADYYPLLPSRGRHGALFEALLLGGMQPNSAAHRERLRRHTDQLIIDLGNLCPPYIEFGSRAISRQINERHDRLFAAQITHLEKGRQRLLKEKFDFLLKANTECFAAMPTTVAIALNLLSRFLERYELKTSIRNSINDLLILATAIQRNSNLLTEDTLLRRFVAETTGAKTSEDGLCLLVKFSDESNSRRRVTFESKGYINRGWQVMERRGGS